MEITKGSLIRNIIEGEILKRLNFGLFNLLKEDLPKDYLINYTDIEFLIMLNDCYSILGKKKTIKNVMDKLDKLILQDPKDFYTVFCDTYELFIDAGRIDRKLNIII